MSRVGFSLLLLVVIVELSRDVVRGAAPLRSVVRVDAYGDPLPPGVIARMGSVRFLHPGCSYLTFSRNGQELVSLDHLGRLSTWDVKSGRERRRVVARAWQHLTESLFLRTELVVGGTKREVYDLVSGKVVRDIPLVPLVSEDSGRGEDRLRAFACAANLSTVVGWECVEVPNPWRLHVYNLKTMKRLHAMPAPVHHQSDGRHSMEISADGKLVAVSEAQPGHSDEVDSNLSVFVWDTETGKKVATLGGLGKSDVYLRFVPGKRWIFTYGITGGRIWDIDSGNPVIDLGKSVNQLIPDGKTAALVYSGERVQEVDAHGKKARIRTGEHILEFYDLKKKKWASLSMSLRTGWGEECTPCADTITAVAISPDRSMVACAGSSGRIMLWDLRTGKELYQHPGERVEPVDVDVSPDGKHVVASWGDRGTVRLFDNATGRETALWLMEGGIRSVRFVEGGRAVLLSGWAGKVRSEDSRDVVMLRDVATGRVLWTYYSEDIVSKVVHAGDLTRVGLWSSSQVEVLEVRTGKRVFQVDLNKAIQGSLALDRSGSHVAISDDRGLHVYEVDTGVVKLKESRENGLGCTLLFCPRTSYLVAGGFRQVPGLNMVRDAIRVWDWKAQKLHFTLDGHNRSTTYLRFSADGSELLGVMRQRGEKAPWESEFWDLGEKTPRARTACGWLGHHDISPLQMHIKNTHSQLQLWDLDSAEVLHRWQIEYSHRQSRCFSDRRTLLVVQQTGNMELYDLLQEVSMPDGPLNAEERTRIWVDLRGKASERVYQAMCRLAGRPEELLAMARQELTPEAHRPRLRIQKLVQDLDAAEAQVRKNAFAELKDLGRLAVIELADAVERPPSPEVLRSAKRLLSEADFLRPNADEVRKLRLLRLLAFVRPPGSVELLRTVAKGEQAGYLASEAKRLLESRAGVSRN